MFFFRPRDGIVVVVVLVTIDDDDRNERSEEEFTARFKVIRANYKSMVGRRDLFLALRTHDGLDTTDLLPVWTLTFIYESSRPIVTQVSSLLVFHFAKFSSN